MKYIALLIALLITAFLSHTSLLAQDSLRYQIPDSVRYAAFDTNVIKGANRLSNSSEVFSYNEYIWSDKRSLSEILEMRNGFRVFNEGFGQRNKFIDLTYPNLNVPVYRDGFKMNILDSQFDTENLSINEIDSIELISSISSYLYSNSFSTSAVNVISKNVVQPQPFSQLRYSQDRYDALFADVYFSQSFSRKFNLQLGLTKGSNAGRYTNSDYDKWQTRTRLNFFLNPDFNILTNFYYNTIDRGLFGGLQNDSSAAVRNDSSRIKYKNIYFNTGIYFKLFSDKNHLTKVTYSYINSLYNLEKGYADSILLPNNGGHSVSNEVNLNQNFKINIFKNIPSNLILNANYDNVKYDDGINVQTYSGFLKYDINYNDLDISLFFKHTKATMQDNTDNSELIVNLNSPGIEAYYKLINKENLKLRLYGGVNYSGRSSNLSAKSINFSNNEAGFDFTFKSLFLKFRYTRLIVTNDIDFISLIFTHGNITVEPFYSDYYYQSYKGNIKFKIWDIVLDLVNDNYTYTDGDKNLFRGNIFYENKFFNNNLDLKTGFIVKYYTGFKLYDYSVSPTKLYEPVITNVDFYIGARIGSANVNFTLANLFNRFNYDTYLYPYDDRGGFANVVSRFTIVWDFLN